MKGAVVTGANGFIGSWLCKILIENKIDVYGVVRSELSNMSRLDEIICSQHLKIIYCDMHKIENLEQALINEDVDIMFYLSWQGITGLDRSDYLLQLDSVECMLNAIRTAKNIGCSRFVGAGTLAELDVNSYSGLDGSTPNAVSTYGVAKITAHYMSKALCNQLGIEHVWAYISNTYGEGDESSNFVNFAIDLIQSTKPNRFTAGEQYYDFVHVKDIAQGLWRIGENGKSNYSYYIGSNEARKLKDYIRIIRDIVNPNAKLELGAVPYNGSITSIERFDCKKIMQDTGYVPQIRFEEGINNLLYYRQKRNILDGYKFEKLNLKGAFKITNFFVGDCRGSFTKCFEKDIYREEGIEFSLNETFVSVSAKNVIRGIHFQINNPQAKLVSVLNGRALDYIVDLRPESKTFKKWTCVELSRDNHTAVYVPKGFGHGFASLEDNTIMLYQCDGAYDKKSDSGIRFDDVELAISWPIKSEEAIHSTRDLELKSFKDYLQNPMKTNEGKKFFLGGGV